MTNLEKITEWLKTYDGYDILGRMTVDYTDSMPGGAVFPNGLIEVSRWENIWGEIIVENQENFGIYCTMLKAPEDDETAEINAEWVADFQRWVQMQSLTHHAPVFGNVRQDQETVKAQNGTLYEASDSGMAVYMIQLSVSYYMEV